MVDGMNLGSTRTRKDGENDMINYIVVPDSDIWEYPVDVIALPNGSLKVITNWDLEDYHNGKIPNPYLV